MVDRSLMRMDEDHRYFYGDDPESWPSVTSILSATIPKSLEYWGQSVACKGLQACTAEALLNARNHPNGFYNLLRDTQNTITHVLEKAQTRGKRIHKFLEDYAKTGQVGSLHEYPASYHHQLSELAGWLLKNDPEFLATEVITFSESNRYAGTLDMRVKIQGRTILGDLKTGKKVYPNVHFPQLIAYDYAEVELGEDTVDALAVLHLPEDGPCRLVEVGPKWGWEDFSVLLDAFARQQVHKRKKAVA